MTLFTSLVDALHSGYEVLGPIRAGYLVRLTRANGMASYGIVTLKPKPEPATPTAHAEDYATCQADFTLSMYHGAAVVKVKGDVNLSNVAAFKAVVDCAETTGSPTIVVALTVTEYVCKQAYRILLGLQAQLESVGGCLCISCGPNCHPQVMMMLLAVPIPVFDTVDDAIAVLHPGACVRST